MARTTAAALDHFFGLLRDPAAGLQAQLQSVAMRDGVALRAVSARSMFLLNAAPDLMDHSRDAEYPELFLFAEQMENVQREKFSFFSGTLRLGAEVRISAETPDRLETDIHRYCEALLNVLHAAPGEWIPGLVYSGRYQVMYSPVRLGGDNFLQTARVTFTLNQFVSE